jgi:hypothetical protein
VNTVLMLSIRNFKQSHFAYDHFKTTNSMHPGSQSGLLLGTGWRVQERGTHEQWAAS